MSILVCTFSIRFNWAPFFRTWNIRKSFNL